MSRQSRTRQLASRLENIACGLQDLQFASFQPPTSTWQPPINAYVCDSKLIIYVDLAGADADSVSVTVSERRVTMSGRRGSPEHHLRQERLRCRQVLAMEIGHGFFERTLSLSVEVDVDEARVDQVNGFLRIRLPLRSSGRRAAA